PPTAGFIGKLYLFAAVLDAKWLWLAMVGVINSVVSLYYYARVLRYMFLRDPEAQAAPIALHRTETLMLIAFIIPTIVLGLYFAPLVDLVNASLVMLGIH
ncbi:MAG TPA: proton-conducting transporter membrane subunit, partial [Bacteroidota bacterium]|nr:proton-conducting transporter membrane subunit [Bacteroidota bacterium]